MTTSVHQLDDGAWVSVNDERVVGVSDLWRLDSGFCDCRLTDFLAEGFVEVGVGSPTHGGPPDVEARVAGQCITCGAQGVTGWVALGRVDPDPAPGPGLDGSGPGHAGSGHDGSGSGHDGSGPGHNDSGHDDSDGTSNGDVLFRAVDTGCVRRPRVAGRAAASRRVE